MIKFFFQEAKEQSKSWFSTSRELYIMLTTVIYTVLIAIGKSEKKLYKFLD